MAADASWLDLLAAALGGGATVKGLDIAYQELRHRSDRKRTAKEFVDKHLDPLLKATDELVGKLRSLAETDFSDIHHANPNAANLSSSDFGSLVYLFGTFWTHVELLRRQGLSVAWGEDNRGKKLHQFLDCLESRRIRIIDRIAQRAVGEVTLGSHLGASEPMSFIQFVKAYESDESFRMWLRPLVAVLARMRHTRERQRLLQYWVVLHAFIDTLDREHIVTRARPGLPQKLTKESWRDLKYRVFGTYLKFVAEPEKYLGPPKRRP
ncbi:MAG: hypothetical protein EPO20_05380 [Betaproteobacteria bacterium]|nr:MAG: hypothetical protein EPO20_05380 [Betaproteobacteria bacterium]